MQRQLPPHSVAVPALLQVEGAVALVWRDPYPARRTPSTAPVIPNLMYPVPNLISPWYQYHEGGDKNDRRKTDDHPSESGQR